LDLNGAGLGLLHNLLLGHVNFLFWNLHYTILWKTLGKKTGRVSGSSLENFRERWYYISGGTL
jgi:hypothetical protein